VAVRRASRRSFAIASAIAPDPVPRSAREDGSGCSALFGCRLDELLGFGTRDQDVARDREIQSAERGAPGDVLDRLAGLAALDPALEGSGLIRPDGTRALEVELGPGQAQQPAEQLLDVCASLIAARQEPLPAGLQATRHGIHVRESRGCGPRRCRSTTGRACQVVAISKSASRQPPIPAAST
jgi:hypothetical protein